MRPLIDLTFLLEYRALVLGTCIYLYNRSVRGGEMVQKRVHFFKLSGFIIEMYREET